jgi:hypothetical protein
MSVVSLTARIGGSDGPIKQFTGRFAWTLQQLAQAGNEGVTPLDRPAPRWSHYVHRLRRSGVPIETINETHTGPYAGRHGRYRLTVPVEILQVQEAL